MAEARHGISVEFRYVWGMLYAAAICLNALGNIEKKFLKSLIASRRTVLIL